MHRSYGSENKLKYLTHLVDIKLFKRKKNERSKDVSEQLNVHNTDRMGIKKFGIGREGREICK